MSFSNLFSKARGQGSKMEWEKTLRPVSGAVLETRHTSPHPTHSIEKNSPSLSFLDIRAAGMKVR